MLGCLQYMCVQINMEIPSIFSEKYALRFRMAVTVNNFWQELDMYGSLSTCYYILQIGLQVGLHHFKEKI